MQASHHHKIQQLLRNITLEVLVVRALIFSRTDTGFNKSTHFIGHRNV